MQKIRKTLPLSHTVIGELYKSLDTKALSELDHYIEKMYATKRNNLVRLHKKLSEYRINGHLDSYSMKDLEMAFMQNKERNYTLFMTYVNRLHSILKEFIILSKIESKNIYTETLWSEYLIESRLKRNLRINQKNYKNFYPSEYQFQADFIHKRESFFLLTIEGTKDKKNIENKAMVMLDSFHEYYLFQSLEFYKSLATSTDWIKRDNKEANLKALILVINQAKKSKNELLKIIGLHVAVSTDIDKTSYYHLKTILISSPHLSTGFQYTIGMGLLFNATRRQIYDDEKLSTEVYDVYNLCYGRRILFIYETQSHMLLGGFVSSEIEHGSSSRAREILAESIHRVSPVQRDSCEKLCLARIEFAKGNYAQALHYIDQGKTSDSLYYFPLFKSILLKILVMLGDELRFRTERENLYKYLHKNIKIDSGIRDRFLVYYRYIDLVRRSRWQALSDYRRKKLKEALLPSAPFFYEKIWMRERVQQLEGEG